MENTTQTPELALDNEAPRRTERVKKFRNVPHVNQYKVAAIQMSLTGMLLALTMVFGLLSSVVVMPSIPVINGRVDIWYAVAVISIVLIKDWKFKLIFVVCMPFLMAPLDFGGYAGWGDYAVEMVAPFLFLSLLAIPLPNLASPVQNYAIKGTHIAVVIIIFVAARLVFSSLAATLFYESTWEAGAIYSWPNILVDAAIMPIAIPFIFVKIKKFKDYI